MLIPTDEEVSRLLDEAITVGTNAGHRACVTLVDTCGKMEDEKMRTVAVAIAFGFLRAKLDVMKSFDPTLCELFNEFQKMGTLYADKVKEEEILAFYRSRNNG
jgi:hypothetical protein